jgi:transposase
VLLHSEPTVTGIAALTTQGIEAVMELDGVVNAAALAVNSTTLLGPTLEPSNVVVLDSLRVHNATRLAELVEKRTARLLFLPPYSPDFTPVELAFSKLKAFLRTAQAHTQQALMAAVRGALDWIGEVDA